VIPTATGIALIEGLPVPTLASPELTGTWEARLARIARGQDTRAAFMNDIVRYVHDVTEAVRTGAPGGMAAAAGPPSVRATVAFPQAPAAATTARGKDALAPNKKKSSPKPPSVPAPVVLATPGVAPVPCPACRLGTLMAGKRGWGCSRWREGCAFVVWFMVNGRRLTDAQLRDLVAKGKTRRGTWAVPGQSPTEGRLILDLTGQRDQGAARFQPG
jgi:DNA topoisomerase-3